MPQRIRIYVDTCTITRPFDDQTQERIFRESQSLFLILGLINQKAVELISSDILEYEVSRNPFARRRNWVKYVFSLASYRQPLNDAIEDRAFALGKMGLKANDALHAASAEAANASCIVSCDDRFIKRYAGPVEIVGPEGMLMKYTNRP